MARPRARHLLVCSVILSSLLTHHHGRAWAWEDVESDAVVKEIAIEEECGDSFEDDGDVFEDEEDSGVEEFILDKPGDVEWMTQQAVREAFTKARAEGDTDGIWPRLNARAEIEATRRQGTKDGKHQVGMKAALLPGGSAVGALAIEGGNMAALLPAAEAVEKTKELVSKVTEEVGGLLAVVGQEVMVVAQQIASGAVVQSGAFDNLPEDYTGEDETPALPYMMVGWFLATERAEADAAKREKLNFPTKEDDEFNEWFFENKGETHGSLTYAEVPNKAGDMRGLIIEDHLEGGEEVVKVPLKSCITQQTAATIRTTGGFLGGIVKSVFQQNEEWGLALVLLYEHFQDKYKDGNSRFAPYIRTLRLYEMGSKVMKELQGTYAAEFKRQWEDQGEESYRWLTQKVLALYPKVFMRNPKRYQAGTYSREDWRWALGVVRRRALRITRSATSVQFYALCPYLDLLPHAEGAGNVTLSLDNHVRAIAGPHRAGSAVYMDRGDLTDAAALFKFHELDPDRENPYNALLVKLPGAGGHQGNIIEKVEKIREWREEMQMPPRAADLFRAATALQLYGSDFEAEEGMLPGARQLGWPGLDPVELPKEGAYSAVQLYSANLFDLGEGETHVLAKHATKSLAKAATQLQQAVALDWLTEHERNTTDAAVQAAINATKNFFFYGIQPSKGLDELDQVLIRKMELMDQCGDPKLFTLTWDEISPALLCGVRVVLANTSEVGVFYQKVGEVGVTSMIPVEEGGFNKSLPISKNNEETALQALTDSVVSLKAWYPTSIDEDEGLLTLTSLGGKVRAAINVRLREKQLLEKAMKHLAALECANRLDDGDDNNVANCHLENKIPLDNNNNNNVVDEETELEEKGNVEAKNNVEVDSNNVEDDHSVEDNNNVDNKNVEDHVGDFVEDYVEDDDEVDGNEDNNEDEKVEEKNDVEVDNTNLEADNTNNPDEKSKSSGKEASRVQRYQVEALAERQLAAVRAAEMAEEAEVARRLRLAEWLKPKVLVEVPVNMGGAEPVSLTVREGDNIEALVADFARKYRLAAGDAEVLKGELRKRAPSKPPLITALPVVMEDGNRYYIAAHEGDNVTAKVEEFVGMWGLSLEYSSKLLPALSERVDRREKRKKLLELPVSAADGRSLVLTIRQGEQHHPEPFVREFLDVSLQSAAAVQQLVAAVWARTPPPQVLVPLSMGGGLVVNLRLADGDDKHQVAAAFVDVHNIPDPAMAVPKILKAINERLYPNAMTF